MLVQALERLRYRGEPTKGFFVCFVFNNVSAGGGKITLCRWTHNVSLSMLVQAVEKITLFYLFFLINVGACGGKITLYR